MKKNINQSHKNLCISNNNNTTRCRKIVYSSVITPKSSKNNIQRSMGSPTINFRGIMKNNSKVNNNPINSRKNKSIERENRKVLKINSINNYIKSPMKVIKVVSSPSFTLSNINYNKNNTINSNVNTDLRKNKTSIDFSSQIIENEDSSFPNNILFHLIEQNKNKNNNENSNRNIKEYNHNYAHINNKDLNNESNNNNHLIIPTKTYYGSPRKEQMKKIINYKFENFQYKSFNKKNGKLKNYLKKAFKEKCESKRIKNYNSMNNNNNNLYVNKNSYNNNKKTKSKNIFSHQKSNPLLKIKKSKYLSQSQVSTKITNVENINIISKDILDFNKSCLQSFIFTKKNNKEKDSINNSFLIKRENEKVTEKRINLAKSLDLEEKENYNLKLNNKKNNDIKELEDLKLKIKELNEKNEELNIEIKEKEKIITDKKENYEKEKNRYEKIIKEKSQQNNNLMKEIKDLKSNNILLSNKIAILNKEKNNYKNEINYKNNEYRELMLKKMELNNILQKIKEKNDKNNNEIKKLTKENNEIKNRIINYIKTIDEYKQKNDSYKYKLEELENKINSLSNNNYELANELENKNKNIIELNNKFNDIKNNNNIIDNKYIKNREKLLENKNIDNFCIIPKENNINKNKKNKKNKKNNKYKDDLEISLENKNNKNYVCQTEIKKNSKYNQLITPNNYNLIISYSINNDLKWYLFKSKSKNNDINNNTLDNIPQKEYNKYIWISSEDIDNIQDFINDSGYKSINNTPIKSIKKEKNTSNININNNIIKLINSQGNISNKDSKKQNKKLIKSNTENGLIGISIIDKDEKEVSNFLEDYCFEDILNDLGDNDYYNRNAKNYNIYNIQNNNNKIYFNTPKKYYPNNINNYNRSNNGNIIYKKESIKKVQKNNLKQTIGILLNQINPNSSFMNTFSSILKQLGCSDDDIFKLIENYNSTNKDSCSDKEM